MDLIQLLRRYRHPVSGAVLASELGISIRSLYGDIATLQMQGASIDGASGLGYVLRPGYVLPPLMFSREEIDALVLGSRWVAARGDERWPHSKGALQRASCRRIAANDPKEMLPVKTPTAPKSGPRQAPLFNRNVGILPAVFTCSAKTETALANLVAAIYGS